MTSFNRLLEKLYSAYSKEVNTSSLAKLDPRFYEEVVTAMDELLKRLKELEPGDLAFAQYMKFHENANGALRVILRHRFRKMASLAVAVSDRTTRERRRELEALTPMERKFLEELIKLYKRYVEAVQRCGKRTRKRLEGTTILVRADLDRFLLPSGGEVRLRKGDIVTLSGEIASILVKKGFAREIRISPRS
ncbi:MAG: hypothetical protein DRN14_01300 [Thermoplasmata archaeon]|nr:MAG: hypothetical protein DRN14_01300 [Thermoplasmata archaeon]